MEQFLTLQGEGFHWGRQAWFIRLAGCDVGCTWCDVKDSWEAQNHPLIDIHSLANDTKSKFVVITGGEPLMYNLDLLTQILTKKGCEVAIETSGAHKLTGSWHWICFSPKKFKQPLPEIYKVANELKIIVYNKHDLQWARKHAEMVNPDCHLYLQPEWSKQEEMLPVIVSFIKKNPEWRMSLQTHKYLNIP